MLLWVLFALLTAAAVVALMLPFWRQRSFAAADAHDVEVYKQQLQEIEQEAARGLLGEAEAEAARIEISRRILAAARAADQAKAARSTRSNLPPYVIGAALPAIALSLYLAVGSPHLPSQPLAARTQQDVQSIEVLVARVEERLRKQPDDGMGWNVIAPVYMRMSRFQDAAEAYDKAAKLLGETAERLANRGEALTMANNGTVGSDARQAFERALSLDTGHTKSSFWLAVAAEQAGKAGEAAAIYRQLLTRDLPDAVHQVVRERLAVAEGKPLPPPSQSAPPGGEVDAAMIDRMVSGLAERLKEDGSDLQGWLKLVRAYTVLGRKEEALDALKSARASFAGNRDALGQIDALARSLGLPS
jgi:cytochrome c-type biogenesis protein CcmH